MSTRSLVLLSFAATMFTFAPSARADVPNPGSSSSSSGGTIDESCTVDTQQAQVAGTQCQTCNPSSTCNSLGSAFNYACTQSSTVQVWCNGPNPDAPADGDAGGCAVRSPAQHDALTGAAACSVVAIAAALFLRRRRAN